jgi:hypothetical protein
MNPSPDSLSPLAAKIAEAEAKLEQLAVEVQEIGMPAASALRRRLYALQIEEKALQRNFEESIQRGEPDSVRLAKIEMLLSHIENEESSVAHDADFLNQAAPSSMWVVAETGAQVADLVARGVKAVVGDHRPLGSSVFVNHSHDDLVDQHGLESESHAQPTGEKDGD